MTVLFAELFDLDAHPPEGVDDALPQGVEAVEAFEREHAALFDRQIVAVFLRLEQDHLGLESDADTEIPCSIAL